MTAVSRDRTKASMRGVYLSVESRLPLHMPKDRILRLANLLGSRSCASNAMRLFLGFA